MSHKLVSLYIGEGEYYTRTDTDNVITELKSEVAQLEDDNALLRRNNEELRKENESLKYSVATLDTDLAMATRWRKVDEELPEDGSDVLATDGEGIWLCYKTTMPDGLPWFQPNGQPHIEGVTHWMPLPSAPKEAK